MFYFSLPDDRDESDRDGDSTSGDDVVPELAPVENIAAYSEEDAAWRSASSLSKKKEIP